MTTFRKLCQSLENAYGDEREARAVVTRLLDVAFGLTMTDVLCGALEQLPSDQRQRLDGMMQQLLAGQPVQYVAGVALFGPRQFAVAPGVLIPRPETYELCQWITADALPADVLPADAQTSDVLPASPPSTAKTSLRVLDIGTGSGCIACTLALDIPDTEVVACDISQEALAIARRNASLLGANVMFEQRDALALPHDEALWDVIVSNPPYIGLSEQADMEHRVLDHEPALALFVPDDDVLLFYRAIARYAAHALRPGGRLYFELNAAHAEATARLLRDTGFHQVELRTDQFTRPRFVKAARPI